MKKKALPLPPKKRRPPKGITTKTVQFWRGKPVSDLRRKELIEALEWCAVEINRLKCAIELVKLEKKDASA